MTKYVFAISSDSRALYKADIYRTLALPEGSVIHFRYKKKYVNINDIPYNSSEEVVIIFKRERDSEIKYIPIRKAKIISSEEVNETELFHVYLELGKFCSVENLSTDSFSESNIFFGHSQRDWSITDSSWHDKVEELKNDFDTIFYYIKEFTQENNKIIKIKKSKDKKGSFYKLNQGSKYLMHISIANPLIHSCTLNIGSSSQDVSINTINPIEISAQYDDLTIPIYLKSLNAFSEISFISFTPICNKNESKNESQTNIEIQKKISCRKSIWFGILSFSLIICGFILKDSIDSFYRTGDLSAKIDWWAISSTLGIIGSLSLLYRIFNKK